MAPLQQGLPEPEKMYGRVFVLFKLAEFLLPQPKFLSLASRNRSDRLALVVHHCAQGVVTEALLHRLPKVRDLLRDAHVLPRYRPYRCAPRCAVSLSACARAPTKHLSLPRNGRSARDPAQGGPRCWSSPGFSPSRRAARGAQGTKIKSARGWATTLPGGGTVSALNSRPFRLAPTPPVPFHGLSSDGSGRWVDCARNPPPPPARPHASAERLDHRPRPRPRPSA